MHLNGREMGAHRLTYSRVFAAVSVFSTASDNTNADFNAALANANKSSGLDYEADPIGV